MSKKPNANEVVQNASEIMQNASGRFKKMLGSSISTLKDKIDSDEEEYVSEPVQEEIQIEQPVVQKTEPVNNGGYSLESFAPDAEIVSKPGNLDQYDLKASFADAKSVPSEPVVEEPVPTKPPVQQAVKEVIIEKPAPAAIVTEPVKAEVPEEKPEEKVVVPDTVDKKETVPEKCIDSDLNASVEALSAKLDNYISTKDQHKEFLALVNKRDGETANRKLVKMLEQLSAMREDYFKLCDGVEAKLDKFSAKDVLESFRAYSVDMENILIDGGVTIGPFPYDKLNTIHQRVVDVIPTDDETLNNMVAERLSEGYGFNDRVLCKEKVNVYRFTKPEVDAQVIDETKEGDE